MGVVGGIITYLLLWWVVLFAVLPRRVKHVWREPDKHARGTERGAPVNPELWWKFKVTSAIAAALWVVVFAVVSSGIFAPDV